MRSLFNVKVDKEDIDKDGFVDVYIHSSEIEEACSDNGGCCDRDHEEPWNVEEFLLKLDDYYFKNALDQGRVYDDIVQLAEGYSV
jgi:hypothetical protein